MVYKGKNNEPDPVASSGVFGRKWNKKGFSLIEMLIVISIIVILSGIILASIGNPTADARDARRVTDLGQIQVALEMYYDGNGFYPKQAVPLEEELSSAAGTGLALLTGDYIPALSVDPKNDATYKYYYCGTPAGETYTLKAKLETDSEALSSDYDKDWPIGMVAESGVGCDCNDTAGYDDDGGVEGEQASAPYFYCVRGL